MNIKRLAEACKFLALDQRRKFLSQRQREFFRNVQREFLAQPDIDLPFLWTPGIVDEPVAPIPYEQES